jgi:hypothetical protein
VFKGMAGGDRHTLEINTVLPVGPKFEFQKKSLESGPGHWVTIDHNNVLVGDGCRIRSKATPPCVAAYNYARIRRLVRLGPALYRFRVAANSAAGFSDPNSYRGISTTVLIAYVFMSAI